MDSLIGGALLQALRSTTSPFFSLAAPSTSYLSTLRFGRSNFPPFTFGRLHGVQKSSSPSLKIIHASKKTFTSFDDMMSNSKLPVQVDFYVLYVAHVNSWPLCKEVGVVVKDKVIVVKIDTEKYPQVASRYKITALPTFVLFFNHKVVRVLSHFVEDLEYHGLQTMYFLA